MKAIECSQHYTSIFQTLKGRIQSKMKELEWSQPFSPNINLWDFQGHLTLQSMIRSGHQTSLTCSSCSECPCLLAHLSRRLRSELIVYRSSRRPSIRACVCVSTLSNMNISKTNGSIATKFYLKHHWVGGLAALGFGPDRIRTLVSMATESSNRVIMVKTVSPLFLSCFSSDPFHTCR